MRWVTWAACAASFALGACAAQPAAQDPPGHEEAQYRTGSIIPVHHRRADTGVKTIDPDAFDRDRRRTTISPAKSGSP